MTPSHSPSTTMAVISTTFSTTSFSRYYRCKSQEQPAATNPVPITLSSTPTAEAKLHTATAIKALLMRQNRDPPKRFASSLISLTAGRRGKLL